MVCSESCAKNANGILFGISVEGVVFNHPVIPFYLAHSRGNCYSVLLSFVKVWVPVISYHESHCIKGNRCVNYSFILRNELKRQRHYETKAVMVVLMHHCVLFPLYCHLHLLFPISFSFSPFRTYHIHFKIWDWSHSNDVERCTLLSQQCSYI